MSLNSVFLKLPTYATCWFVDKYQIILMERTFYWTLFRLKCAKVCLCSSHVSTRSTPPATPWKPIFFIVFQTSYFFLVPRFLLSSKLISPSKERLQNRLVGVISHIIFQLLSFLFYPMNIALPVSTKYHIVLVMCVVSKVITTISIAGDFEMFVPVIQGTFSSLFCIKRIVCPYETNVRT